MMITSNPALEPLVEGVADCIRSMSSSVVKYKLKEFVLEYFSFIRLYASAPPASQRQTLCLFVGYRRSLDTFYLFLSFMERENFTLKLNKRFKDVLRLPEKYPVTQLQCELLFIEMHPSKRTVTL